MSDEERKEQPAQPRPEPGDDSPPADRPAPGGGEPGALPEPPERKVELRVKRPPSAPSTPEGPPPAAPAAPGPRAKEEEKELRVVASASGQPDRSFATYRSAPVEAEQASRPPAPAAEGPAAEQQRVSAGFVLGVALLIVAVLSGVAISWLNRRVEALEQDVKQLQETLTLGTGQ
jgi:hypothetical protein